MSPLEFWAQLCSNYSDADKQLREAVQVVTDNMKVGTTGVPSRQDLRALESAKVRFDGIWTQMGDFMKRQGVDWR